MSIRVGLQRHSCVQELRVFSIHRVAQQKRALIMVGLQTIAIHFHRQIEEQNWFADVLAQLSNFI